MTLDKLWARLMLSRAVATTAAGRGLRILNRVALTPAHSVHVIEVEGERLVIGCHASGLRVLSRIRKEAE